MMKARNCIGRCVTRGSGMMLALMACLWSVHAVALPGTELEAFSATWTQTMGEEHTPLDPFHDQIDEKIFTEVSPIIDTPEGVKLPEDQKLSD